MVVLQANIEGGIEIEGTSQDIDPDREEVDEEAQSQEGQRACTVVGTPVSVAMLPVLKSQIFIYVSGVRERQLDSPSLLVHLDDGDSFTSTVGDFIAAAVEGGIGVLAHGCTGDDGYVSLVSLLVRAEHHEAALRTVEHWIDETRDVGGVFFRAHGYNGVLSFAWRAQGAAGAMKAIGHPESGVDRVARVETRCRQRVERRARARTAIAHGHAGRVPGRVMSMASLEAVWRLQAAWRRWLSRRTWQRLMYEVRARLGEAARVRQVHAATILQAAIRGVSVRDRYKVARAVAVFVARQARVDAMVAQYDEPAWLTEAWDALQSSKNDTPQSVTEGRRVSRLDLSGPIPFPSLDAVSDLSPAVDVSTGAGSRALTRWAWLLEHVVERVRTSTEGEGSEEEGEDVFQVACEEAHTAAQQQTRAPSQTDTSVKVASDEMPFAWRVLEGRLLTTVTLLGHEMRCMSAYTAGLLSTYLAPRRTEGRQRRKRRRLQHAAHACRGSSSGESEEDGGYATAEEW